MTKPRLFAFSLFFYSLFSLQKKCSCELFMKSYDYLDYFGKIIDIVVIIIDKKRRRAYVGED